MKTIHVIAGATASGKSAYAIKLAQKLGGIIINADSLQLYNALPILTAAPSYQDKAQVPHVLYAALEPHEACSAGNWREMAGQQIGKAFAKGAVPIIVGGSGLYLKALMQGLAPIPDIPSKARSKACADFDEMGAGAFFERLKAHDPNTAARLHPNHKARVLRAWEVFDATGRGLSDWHKAKAQGPLYNWNFNVRIIMPARDVLYARCNERFCKMIEMGALDEVRAFEDAIKDGGIPQNASIHKALGLSHLRAHLKGGLNLDKAIELAQGDTRRYAKRQVTWLRGQLRESARIKIKTIF